MAGVLAGAWLIALVTVTAYLGRDEYTTGEYATLLALLALSVPGHALACAALRAQLRSYDRPDR